jgi:transposase-like protein
MLCHDAFQAESVVRLEQPDCPRCGDATLFPHTAEFAGEGQIRHGWICETCGSAFQTTIELPRGARRR